MKTISIIEVGVRPDNIVQSRVHKDGKAVNVLSWHGKVVAWWTDWQADNMIGPAFIDWNEVREAFGEVTP